MTHEDMINSFPSLVFISPWWSLAFLVIGVLIGAVLAKIGVVIPVTIITIAVGCWIMLSVDYGRSEEYVKAKEDWKKNVFYSKYLPTVTLDEMKIVQYQLNNDGTVTALIDTDKNEKSLSSVNNIKYFLPNVSHQKPYSTARWVESLDNLEIPAAFYDVTIYLPKEN
jgi:hypothetical protein